MHRECPSLEEWAAFVEQALLGESHRWMFGWDHLIRCAECTNLLDLVMSTVEAEQSLARGKEDLGS